MSKIGQQWLNLPQDILLEVFRYLTFEEKANVRATCKYLQQLIDHPTLWLNKTIVLKSLQNCNPCFWTTLRKRRIRSLLIREATPKQLQKMVNLIPNLAAVSMDVKVNVERLRALRPLANLQTLQLNNSSLNLDQELLREVVNFKQLTTLVLCSLVSGHSSSLCLLAELKKLQSLTLHARQKSPSLSALQYILFQLPKLRELSLSSVNTWENLSLCFTAPERKTLEEADGLESHCIAQLQLEKLSLLHSANGPLSRKALKQLSNVRSLSVSLTKFCVSQNTNFVHSMLEGLPNITELELSWNGPFAEFVSILPSNLTRVDLVNARLSDADVQLLSDSSGKSLKHLGLMLCSGITETMLKQLPKQFPCLQTLDLSKKNSKRDHTSRSADAGNQSRYIGCWSNSAGHTASMGEGRNDVSGRNPSSSVRLKDMCDDTRPDGVQGLTFVFSELISQLMIEHEHEHPMNTSWNSCGKPHQNISVEKLECSCQHLGTPRESQEAKLGYTPKGKGKRSVATGEMFDKGGAI